jgi:heme exporter protein D
MWKLILLLWLIPTALAILVGSRLWSGMPALSRNQRRLLFDERRARELTPWLLIKLAVLASSFFMIGLVEGVILLNLPFVWLALAASLTGSAAILLSALWVRSSSQLPRIFRRVVARTASRRRQRAQISSD